MNLRHKKRGTTVMRCRPGTARRLTFLVLGLCCFLLLAKQVNAASDTWTGASNSSYNATGNWAGGSVPNGTTQVGTFPNGATTTNVNLPTGVISVDRFEFNATGPSYNFTIPVSGDLRLYGGGLVNNSPATNFYSVNGASPTAAYLRFYNSASAGSGAQITTNSYGRTYFNNNANAGTASLIQNTGGYVLFYNNATAGQATFTSNGGRVYFYNTSTANQATITTNSGGYLFFTDTARAGQANLVTNSGGRTYFQATSTADQATLTTNAGGNLYFTASASGGQARLVTNAGGNVSFSGLTSAGTTVGSIAGAGNYLLGSRWLETGYDNTDTEVAGVISGTGGSLRKVGTGTLTLSGANTYTGGTTVTAGTIRATGGANRLGTAGVTTIDAGATIDLTGNNQTFAQLGGAGNLSNIGNLTVSAGAFSGLISGAGSLTKTGTGTLTLSGANTYTGNTTVSAGILSATGGDNRLSTTGVTTISTGATLDLTGNNQAFAQLSGAGNLSNIGNLTVSAGTFSGLISGAGSLTKAGTGTLTLSGANTYAGGTTLTAGTLATGSNTAFGTGTLTLNGGTLQASVAARTLSNAIAVGNDFAIGGTLGLTLSGGVDLGGATRTLTVTNTGATTFAGVLSNGSLTKAGTRTLTLSGANTYTDTTVLAGTLTATGGSNRLGTTGTVTINSGATVNLSGNAQTFATLNGVGSLTNIGGINIGSGTFSGVISGTGGTLEKVGAGTLTLSGANTYTGGTTLTAGTLAAGSNTAFGTGALTLNGGTLQASGTRAMTNSVSVTSDFSIGGGASDNLTLSGAINLGGASRTLNVNSAGSTTLSGAISNGGLAKAGTGSLTLSGPNTYAGGTSLTAGTLAAGNNTAFGTGTLTLNGGTLQASVAARTLSNAIAVGNDFAIGGTLGLTLSGGVDLGGATRTLTVTNTGGTTLSGSITNGGLAKAGAGTLTLSGANTYAGGTTLTAGTLAAGSNTAFGTGTLTLNGGTLQASGVARTLSNNVAVGGDFAIGGTLGLTLSGGVDLGGATRTINVTNTGGTTLSGGISNGGLAKAGTRSLTLSGPNTYTGSTDVLGGILRITNTSASALMTAGTAGTLQLDGVFNGGARTISANNGGLVQFLNNAGGGQATLFANAGGNVSFSGLTSAGTTVGSIAGAGNYLLGSKWLETGHDNTDTEVSGVISGTGGSLRKEGAGILTLSGANTYTGATSVQGGELRLTGSLNSSLGVDSGTRLSGAGTSTGSLTMNPGAIYSVEINPSLSGSRVGLQVGGNATLNQNLLQYDFPAVPTTYVPQYRYDVLVYGGAATGTFVLPNFSNAFYTQELLHDTGNRRYVLLTGWNPLVSVVQSSVNQQAVAQALDRAWQAGALSEVIQPILMMSGPQAEAAFGQLAGSECAAPIRGVFNRAGDFKAGVQARLHGFTGGEGRGQPLQSLASLRSCFRMNTADNYLLTQEPRWPDCLFPGIQGYGGWEFNPGVAATLVAAALTMDDHGRPYPGNMKLGVGGEVERQDIQGFWVTATGQEERLKGDNYFGPGGVRLRTGGIQAGYDHLFGKVRLGVSASYSDSTAHFANSLDYSRSRGGLGAFYGQYQGGWRNWYANLGLGYGVYTNDLKRILSFAAPALEAQGNSQTDLLLGFTEAGFDMLREGPLTLQPFAGVLLAEIMTSSFTEKGAEPYNLRFSGDTYRSRQSNVGARLILRDAVGSRWPYRLEVEASWRHEFANRDIPVNTAFAANPVFGFTSFGAPRAANTLLLESGGSLSLGRGVQITGRVAYSYDSCQSGVAVSAGLQKAW